MKNFIIFSVVIIIILNFDTVITYFENKFSYNQAEKYSDHGISRHV